MSYGLAMTKTEKSYQVPSNSDKYELLKLESVDDFLTVPIGSTSKIERLIKATPDEAQRLCSDDNNLIYDLYDAYQNYQKTGGERTRDLLRAIYTIHQSYKVSMDQKERDRIHRIAWNLNGRRNSKLEKWR